MTDERKPYVRNAPPKDLLERVEKLKDIELITAVHTFEREHFEIGELLDVPATEISWSPEYLAMVAEAERRGLCG